MNKIHSSYRPFCIHHWPLRVLTGSILAATLFTVGAKPIHLSTQQQPAFKQAVYQSYSEKMRQGGWYDEIAKGGKPTLRISDCSGNHCLVAVVHEAKFNESLFLVALNGDGTFSRMEKIDTYGTAYDKAVFVRAGSASRIYIVSRTHMGTVASQVFTFDGSDIGKQLAMRTTNKGKQESTEGDQSVLRKATKLARKASKPVEF